MSGRTEFPFAAALGGDAKRSSLLLVDVVNFHYYLFILVRFSSDGKISQVITQFGSGESLRLTPPRARVADLHPGADMGVAGSTQRLRPLVNPDGSIGIKVRTRLPWNAFPRSPSSSEPYLRWTHPHSLTSDRPVPSHRRSTRG
jgi:hypothetical protein